MWLWPCVLRCSLPGPNVAVMLKWSPLPHWCHLVWGRGEGGRRGHWLSPSKAAMARLQPAPSCSIVSPQRSQRLDTVGTKLDKFKLVLVLLIIAFATPDLKGYIQPSSQNMYIFHLWNDFCSLLPGALVLQCSARLVWREREDWETGLNRQAVIQSDKITCVRAPSYWLLTIFCIFKAGMRRYSCQLSR